MSGEWKQAYEAQMETWRWCRSDQGLAWRQQHFIDNADGLLPDTQEMLRTGYRVEEDKLLHGAPYYVSAEMCEVVDHARHTFDPEPILPTDFLTHTGFMYFAKPFLMPDRWSHDTWLGAFSWTPMVMVPEGETEDITLKSWYEDPRSFDDKVAQAQTGVSLTLYAQGRKERWPSGFQPPPQRVPIHHTPWWFGMTFEGNDVDENGEPTGVAAWWRIVQATLRISQQKIAHHTSEQPDRATRRRGTARGFPERNVVVVKLRRELADHIKPEPGGEANYSHRFIVGGHWRQQPYPSEGVIRQIWISPYVKGPEDQPLIIKPKRVYNLVR